jgi:hypothetical protein
VASAIVRTAFRDALIAAYPGLYFDTLNRSPVFVPDEGGQPVPTIWYTLKFPVAGAERRMSIGAPACRRETGQVDVWCICASGVGDAPALSAAEGVRELLRDKQLTPAIRATEAQPPIHFTSDDGDYFTAVVAVHYVHDFVI